MFVHIDPLYWDGLPPDWPCRTIPQYWIPLYVLACLLFVSHCRDTPFHRGLWWFCCRPHRRTDIWCHPNSFQSAQSLFLSAAVFGVFTHHFKSPLTAFNTAALLRLGYFQLVLHRSTSLSLQPEQSRSLITSLNSVHQWWRKPSHILGNLQWLKDRPFPCRSVCWRWICWKILERTDGGRLCFDDDVSSRFKNWTSDKGFKPEHFILIGSLFR